MAFLLAKNVTLKLDIYTEVGTKSPAPAKGVGLHLSRGRTFGADLRRALYSTVGRTRSLKSENFIIRRCIIVFKDE